MRTFIQFMEAYNENGPLEGLKKDLRRLKDRYDFIFHAEKYSLPAQLDIKSHGSKDFMPIVLKVLSKWGFSTEPYLIRREGENVTIRLHHEMGDNINLIARLQNQRRPYNPDTLGGEDGPRHNWLRHKETKIKKRLPDEFSLGSRSIKSRWALVHEELYEKRGAWRNDIHVKALVKSCEETIGSPAFYTNIKVLSDALEDAGLDELAQKVRTLINPK